MSAVFLRMIRISRSNKELSLLVYSKMPRVSQLHTKMKRAKNIKARYQPIHAPVDFRGNFSSAQTARSVTLGKTSSKPRVSGNWTLQSSHPIPPFLTLGFHTCNGGSQ